MNKTSKPTFYSVLCASMMIITTLAAASDRPRIYVTPEQRDRILKKINTDEEIQKDFAERKQRVDKYIAKVQKDPDWLTSRLAMNWDTHYTTTVVENERSVGGEGHAPVPTPRFEGARDWETNYCVPNQFGSKGRTPPIDELIPYNDRDGKIRLINKETDEFEWVSPAKTGHVISYINRRVMGLALDAAFVYWVTGEEKYAELAAPILWKYMHGFSYTNPPKIRKGGGAGIIGPTTFEVIHEGIFDQVARTYDLLYDYIARHDDMEGSTIEQGLKRVIERVIEGGGRRGNWNLNQAGTIIHCALALDDNEAYDDGKGRSHYVDIALNADKPSQKGLALVIEDGFCPDTGLWPESVGYGFGTIKQVIRPLSLLFNEPQAEKLLNDPILTKAIFAQPKLIYPSGRSVGIGDSKNRRISRGAAELLLSWKRKQGEIETAAKLSALLQREIDAGHYSRAGRSDILSLSKYVAELPKPADPESLRTPVTYNAKPLNIVMLRNRPSDGNNDHTIAAAMYGTDGGHSHDNGLAIELFGGGRILGIDSGVGSSYWQHDHRHYYSQTPGHNTVIVNGKSTAGRRMEITKVKPGFGEAAEDSNVIYAQGKYEYKKPAATQERTLALVRIDDTTAFFFDVFRSRLDESQQDEYHDFIYHNMGEIFEVSDGSGNSLAFEESSLLTAEQGNLKGYNYFKDEHSVQHDGSINASWQIEFPGDGKKVVMDVFMPSGEKRRVFKGEAPGNRARRGIEPKSFWKRPVPTLVVRQNGEAWNQPFVTVYAPRTADQPRQVNNVTSVGDNTWLVSGEDWIVELKLNGDTLSHRIKRLQYEISSR